MPIAYQGVRGAYSEEALYKFFGSDVTAVGFDASEEVFHALHDDRARIGILPVENSIVGTVNVNLDLLYQNNFFVIGEVFLPINHHLLAPKGAKLEDVTEVYSHPIALAQCRAFIQKYNLKAISAFDTAGSARNIAEEKAIHKSTICSVLCAEYYDLDVLASNIQTVSNNITRFLIFVPRDKIPEGLAFEKTSLAFCVKHHPGSLVNCLKLFAEYGINLTKIESRPIPENPFEYTFFVDFIGGYLDKNVQTCLDLMEHDVKSLKILGSYPMAKDVIKFDVSLV